MDLQRPIEGESVVTTDDDPSDPIRYRVWEPTSPPRATLALLAGVMSNAAWFRGLAAPWRARGFRVVGVERRGSGLNDGPHHGDARSAAEVLTDARRVIERARDGERPVVVVGWCWGANVAVNLTLKMGSSVAGLALLSPGLFPSSSIIERMRALADEGDRHPEDAVVLDSPITEEMFTTGPALEGFILRDDARWKRFTPRFLEVSGRLSLAAQMRLRRVQVPVFAALGRDDEATDNARTEAELARLPSGRVRTVSLPGGHGLQFDVPDELAGHLDAWAVDALGV
ncbi:MAG: lysophospholipase [Deltaproteobacteria bacterium]|nr:lysophospholipase [Deltaproteobacteria bacterium]